MENADQAAEADPRTCTCPPGEHPLPCTRKFALYDCWQTAVLEETRKYIVTLKNRDRLPHEQAWLDYFKRVEEALWKS